MHELPTSGCTHYVCALFLQDSLALEKTTASQGILANGPLLANREENAPIGKDTLINRISTHQKLFKSQRENVYSF